MKQLLLATGLFALGVGTAAAQDAAYDWSGAYVGAQTGYGWGNSEYMAVNGAFADPDPDGFFGGVYLGYNAQLTSGIVLGLEGDFAFSRIRGAGVFPLSPNFVSNADVNWSTAVRARIGYQIDRFLPYIAGGIAIADYDHDLIMNGVLSDGSSDTYSGWTLGGGVEYAVTSNLILRGDYRFSDFGSARYPTTIGALDHKVDLTTNDLRLGIAYKF